MTDTAPNEVMLHDPSEALDPLTDAEDAVVKNRAKVGSSRPSAEDAVVKNRAKVGSSRPSSLL
ncbi:hypothetical protein H7I58_16045, partial [Mycolicibacterium moriokaense]|uniref:hypothetical protein n=1 Tax=Mycolicibacterium moriokaense TaxID=39691 RepID=UPI0021F2C1E5